MSTQQSIWILKVIFYRRFFGALRRIIGEARSAWRSEHWRGARRLEQSLK
jgi:hypothetical protein